MTNPEWRTEKIARAERIQHEIEEKSRQQRALAVEVAVLKQRLKKTEESNLPILLYACCFKDDDSGRRDYKHLYYLPDLKKRKVDTVTRHILFEKENLLRPNTLDLRLAFKNCGFPEQICSTATDYWTIGERNQPLIDKAVSNLESVIEHLFACEEIDSWQHLRERLTAYYLPEE